MPSALEGYLHSLARGPDEAQYPDLWDSLLGCWAPDTGPQGASLLDHSGSDHHLTRQPQPGIVFPSIVGSARGPVLSCDDSTTIACHTALRRMPTGNAPFTLTCWFNATTAAGFRSPMGTGSNASTAGEWTALQVDNSAVLVVRTTGDTLVVSSGVTLTAGLWYHAAYTWDGVTSRVYLNGRQVATSATAPTTTAATCIFLGAANGAGSVIWHGLIDAPLLYRRALTPAEVWLLGGQDASPLLASADPMRFLGNIAPVDPEEQWRDAMGFTEFAAGEDVAISPIFLLHFTDLERIFGTADVPDAPFDVELLLAEGSFLSSVQLTLDELNDTVQYSGAEGAFLADLEALGDAFLSSLQNTPVQILVGAVDMPYTYFQPIFTGTVERYQKELTGIRTAFADLGTTQRRNLNTLLGGQYFVGTPADNRGLPIPMAIGRLKAIPAIQVQGNAASTLAFSMTSGDNSLLLLDPEAPFPATGTVTIAAETGVTYTSRRLRNVSGVTYLELLGLTRGSPVSHSIGDAVTLTNVAYVYLIGYELPAPTAVDAVYEAGVLVNPVNYTYSVSTTAADHPVSLLTFAAQPAGEITVDIGLTLPNAVTNGGWESGNNTGWTTANGGSVVVGTTSPDPYAGTYRAALTGRLNASGDNYQDLPVTVGEVYEFGLYYYNTYASSVLINGSFEDGLDDWTVVFAPFFSMSIDADTFDDMAPDGEKYCKGYIPDFLLPGATLPENPVSIYQDFTVTSGLPYIFSFMYRTFLQLNYLNQPVFGTTVSFSLGTPSTPEAYIPLTTMGYTHKTRRWTIVDGEMRNGQPTFTTSGTFTWTPTDTTARLVFRFSFNDIPGATISGNTVIQSDVSHADIDAILIQPTLIDRSTAFYQLGTPANPTLYSSEALAQGYQWTESPRITFQSVHNQVRVTLQSQYTNTALPTYFDDVQIIPLSGGAGAGHPMDILQYILDTFLSHVTYSSTAFATARTHLPGWRFGGYLPEPGDSEELMQSIARQAQMLLARNGAGVLEPRVLAGEHGIEAAFTAFNIKEPEYLVAESPPLNIIYTSVYVYFAPLQVGSTDPRDFRGSTYATPTETTDPDAPYLVDQCATALAFYGRERRLDFVADWIQDFAQANLLLRWLVARHTDRGDSLTLTSWLATALLRVGQRVTATHQVIEVGGNQTQLCEVIAKNITPPPGLTTLTLRALGATTPPAPVAEAIELDTEKNVALSFSALDYATASAGTELDPALVDLDDTQEGRQAVYVATEGTFTVTSAGLITFTPDLNVVNVDGVGTYAIADLYGTYSNVADITIHVLPPPNTYPFDLVAGGTGGWSTRLLRAAYAGSALRVRRSSDNAEQDIGFSGDDLDTVSLLAFVGANDGFVVTLYDQSGNTRHQTQATASLQPKIVNAGSLITTIGGKACLDFDGVDNFLATTATIGDFINAGTGTIFSVFQPDTLPAPAAFVYNDPPVWADSLSFLGAHMAGGGTPRIAAYNWDGNADAANATVAAGSTTIHVWRHGGGTLYSHANSSTASNSTASGNTDAAGLAATMRLGHNYDVAYFDGKLSEVLCWDSDLSAGDLTLVGDSTANYFTQTWS